MSQRRIDEPWHIMKIYCPRQPPSRPRAAREHIRGDISYGRGAPNLPDRGLVEPARSGNGAVAWHNAAQRTPGLGGNESRPGTSLRVPCLQ
eukprot:COSAG01_NODE_2568_length_7442_cov_23.918970_7_plen_91_part_00